MIILLNQTFTSKNNSITLECKHPYANIYYEYTEIKGII